MPDETVVDMEPVDESRTRQLKIAGKRLLRRGVPESTDMPPRERERKPFKAMRNLMRLGRARRQIPDEEQGLLPVAGPSSAPDLPPSPTTVTSSDEMLVDTRPYPDTPRRKRKTSVMRTSSPSINKAADFQVCVTIIEARQLTGLNMDPVVCVQVGDERTWTSVKESTNCPYFNEYFVFDFHEPPVILFDKIITLSVMHSRHLRTNKMLGTFKLDVATVWNEPDRQFHHKWALLTDPDDMMSGPKGYLKVDISVIGKGDTVKVPAKSEKDEDDIEANLLLPDGVTIERQRCRYIVRIHRADGLPKMNYSILANVKKTFTGESQDLVDPYVQVSYAGMTGQTTVKKNCYNPEWNEQVVFTEMFPPLCQRIKLQLRDNDPVHPNVIGTNFIDLKTISHDGEKGFLPTFGPSYIYFYGSTRDYSLLDQHSNLNSGMGEGLSYRARMLVSIRTEIMDTVDIPVTSTPVVVERIMPINELAFKKNEEFLLFASIFDVNMIDKRLTDKPIQFELSIGNAGNTLDGHHESVRRPQDLAGDLDELSSDVGYWQSTTEPMRASSADKVYYSLPYWEYKQCMHVRSIWPDHRRRMYNSNLIANIIDKFEEGLSDAQIAAEQNGRPHDKCVAALKSVLDSVSVACAKYVTRMTGAAPIGTTKLDRERLKLCISEMEQISALTRNLKARITKHCLKDRLRTAFSYLTRLKRLCEDAQPSMPDVFLWMISNGKRLAYHRINARDIIFSEAPDEKGRLCGKIQTIFMKWPGKRAGLPSGWAIPAKLTIYVWLGVLQDKKHFIDELPPGYEHSLEIKNHEKLRAHPPSQIFYAEKHTFQLRAYIYQARSLIGSDSSGLSDPYARVVMGDCSGTTQVIEQTLSPTWDELIVLDDVLIYGTVCSIKANPPTIVVEIFDQDKVGKSEFIGRILAKPVVIAYEEIRDSKRFSSALEWFEVYRGDAKAGELLATFELLEIPHRQNESILPALPQPKKNTGKAPSGVIKYVVYPVPEGIRPTLSRYRLVVLFWGLRDLKRIHMQTVNKPRVEIECAGNIIYSTVIQNAKHNPNFASPIKYVADVDLPDQDLYWPPLTIRVVDIRSFGRTVLVGTHIVNSIDKQDFSLKSELEREFEKPKKSLLPNMEFCDDYNFEDDEYAIENERESCPLLAREGRPALTYGSGAKLIRKFTMKGKGARNRKASTDSVLDDNESGKDWWTKYYASYESMIEEENENKKEHQLHESQVAYIGEIVSPQQEAHCSHQDPNRPKRQSSRYLTANLIHTGGMKKNEIPISGLIKIYPHELEAVPEYEEFKEWLQPFELYRGKKTNDEPEDDNRVVGVFKGALKAYKLPLPRGKDDHTVKSFDPGFFHYIPKNDPIRVLLRIYIIKATDLHPMDLNGKADPYVVILLGSKKISDKKNYVSKQLNPVFGKCFEIEGTFPQDSTLTIQLYDWDILGADELIGETKIDLENRFYSHHRATCGLPIKYEEQGYNRWRDAMKPTQILAKLCKEGKLDPPIYEYGRVTIDRTVFYMSMEEDELCSNPDTIEEQMALNVLRRWQEMPRVGYNLITEHVETRSLYNPKKPGIDQGRLQMWVDMFPMDQPVPPAVDISARKPKSYEMRVVVWNTDDVVLEDDAFFTGEKMSDIYVKGWLKGPEDCQTTDIHYRSLTGEGNFNWRFKFPFRYLEAEERIVITRKESIFSWDENECKIPPRLELQVWDADHFSADDFLGSVTLDLNRFPRGAKSSKLCTLEMLRNDETVPTVNIFKQKRIKGWWPFYIMKDTEEMVQTGKIEAEFHLLTEEEAERAPAGLGRSEPDPLDKPNRPDASFTWFLNPLRSIRYIVWQNYKRTIIKFSLVFGVALFIFLLFFNLPGYLIKKLLGA